MENHLTVQRLEAHAWIQSPNALPKRVCRFYSSCSWYHRNLPPVFGFRTELDTNNLKIPGLYYSISN